MLKSPNKSNPEKTAAIVAPLRPYLIRTDAAGIVLSISENFSELLASRGITATPYSGITDLFSWLAGQSPLDAADLIENGFPDLFELRVADPDGEYATIRWMAVPFGAEHGIASEWQLTGIKIPGKKLASQHTGNTGGTLWLQKEKDHSDLIINSLPGIFYVFDSTGKFLRWNKRLETVSGYSHFEISRMKPTDFFSETEKAYITNRITIAFEQGMSDAQSALKTKTGEEIPHYFNARLISFEGGPALIGMGIDISERIRAEEKTRLSNDRYILATRATNDAIWDWDVKLAAPLWGEGLFTQFGYQPAEAVNVRNFWETRIHPADQDRVTRSMAEFIRSKSVGLWSEEYRFRKACGDYAIVADRGFLVFSDDGMVKRVVGSMQDITEKKKLEQKLFQQELNKQKIVAKAMIDAQENERAEIGKELHDNVNQILSTSKLYLELYKSDHAEGENLLDLCLHNITHAIHEIRNISRALVPSTIVDLGLPDAIQDLLETIRLTGSIHVEFHAMDWYDDLTSKEQKLMLFRIVQEQVNNVMKHAQAKNLIIRLSLNEAAGRINLSMADDGKGFNPEKTKKGLGLSNMMSRTDLFGGKISIVSSVGKGCKISVEIPIHNLSKPY
jgi:PAS domain S-box-containing protein